ncbi:MAG TPA: YebC/PmpR family DNA-binding transcriptional regulator [bacterium]|nr:YebC/PmpR family DNA-binding transcriptional regulator [bacterium]HPJ71203.1 YebC/PmpR family DNA-binding transcriptional regulator [bacterium]HPQ66106.1 YebC/PmpR family DNA-binding transcriptional regulator [bacterium]
MSGHSKWHSIRHKKGAADAKRGKIFSRLSKEITVLARDGGGDIKTNPRLRTTIQAARAANMPAENIDRAIKKGTGELPGVTYEELVYEGYGPGGVAIMLRILTDNKNRSAAEIRHIFDKRGGNMGGPGAVAWMFEQKGLITVEKSAIGEETLFGLALDAGAEDFRVEDDAYQIMTGLAEFEVVKAAIEEAGIEPSLAEITQIPQNEIRVSGEDAKKVWALVNALEDHEDVQNVYSNFDIPDEILAELED